jgi:uncharacterized membrane protein
MSVIILYLITAAIFLIIDVVMLNAYMSPFFRQYVGHIMADTPRMGPAAVFYLAYVGGMLYFVSLPSETLGQVFVSGLVLGALAYGTFEFTNYAIFTEWNMRMVITDVIWGAVLTATSATAGMWVSQKLGVL